MQPANLPLDIYRGDSKLLRIKLWGRDPVTGNQIPADLTNVIVKSEIRDRPGGTQVTPFTCHVTLPNIIELFLPSAKSQQLPQSGVWDLQLSYGDGVVQTPLAGQVQVTPDVTESTPTPSLYP